MREDNKMFLFNIYHDLEVDDAVANPINTVKFPIEDGNLTQDSFNNFEVLLTLRLSKNQNYSKG